MRAEDLVVGKRYKLPRPGEVGTLIEIDESALYFEADYPTSYNRLSTGLVPILRDIDFLSKIEPEK